MPPFTGDTGVVQSARHAPIPPGPVRAIADRALVQTNMGQVKDVIDVIDQATGGLVLARGNNGVDSTRAYIRKLRSSGFAGPVLFDGESYRHHVATIADPFQPVGTASLLTLDLDGVLDDQLRMGVDIALTPTGRFEAGDTDALKAAVSVVSKLERDDFILVVPLDPSFLTDTYIDQTEAILRTAGHPVAIILTGQFDPLENHTRSAIRNLRRLCRNVPHICFFRTDLSALDLIAHGALACSIGTGGSTRHMVPAGERAGFRVDDRSPSLLFEDLGSWQKGGTIAKKFGGKTAPRCPCTPCGGRTLAGYLGSDDLADARAHSVLVWQGWLAAILAQPSLVRRAEHWKAICVAAINNHEILAVQLGRLKPFQAQASLKAWASLDAWDVLATV